MKLYDDKEQEKMIWDVREGSLGSTAWVPGLPDTWPGWEDSAVPTPKVGPYLRDLRKLFDKYALSRRSTAISVRAASIAASGSISTPLRGLRTTARSWRKRPP